MRSKCRFISWYVIWILFAIMSCYFFIDAMIALSFVSFHIFFLLKAFAEIFHGVCSGFTITYFVMYKKAFDLNQGNIPLVGAVNNV